MIDRWDTETRTRLAQYLAEQEERGKQNKRTVGDRIALMILGAALAVGLAVATWFGRRGW